MVKKLLGATRASESWNKFPVCIVVTSVERFWDLKENGGICREKLYNIFDS